MTYEKIPTPQTIPPCSTIMIYVGEYRGSSGRIHTSRHTTATSTRHRDREGVLQGTVAYTGNDCIFHRENLVQHVLCDENSIFKGGFDIGT